MVVPRRRAAGSTPRMRPPSMRTRQPSPSRSALESSTRATAAIDDSASPRKPSVRHALEIVEGAELRGRVAVEREHHVVAVHPGAVVVDRDPSLAAGVERDRDARGAGVERVLDQLLDHRRRTLDDLAGGDLAHQPVVEESDLRHVADSIRTRRTIVTKTVAAVGAINPAAARRPRAPARARAAASPASPDSCAAPGAGSRCAPARRPSRSRAERRAQRRRRSP